MYKNTTKHRNHNEHDISADLEKIKSALFDTAKDMHGKAKEMWSDSIENVKEKSTDAKETVSDYILNKPIKSVGIALLSGLVMGFLLRGNRKK